MYVIIWEYRAKAEHSEEFEKIYGSNGEWADLFQRQNGYIGTELLRDRQNQERYITIDRWVSLADYESFLSQWEKEYEALDAQCTGLTEQEAMLGTWEAIDDETR
jgi:heme-degrading monooxygenase HmoA